MNLLYFLQKHQIGTGFQKFIFNIGIKTFEIFLTYYNSSILIKTVVIHKQL